MALSGPRPAGPPDLAALEALERAAFPDEAWSASQLRGLLDRPDGIAWLLLDADDQPLAAALGWAAGGVCELLRIAVHPRARRQGLGQRLLADFGSACQIAGADELWLEVRADNAPALALYMGAGLAVTGRRARYYSDGTDAILMGGPLPLEPALNP